MTGSMGRTGFAWNTGVAMALGGFLLLGACSSCNGNSSDNGPDPMNDAATDAMTDGGVQLQDCEPFGTTDCPDDRKCGVVVDENLPQDDPQRLFFACVPREGPQKQPGSPCRIDIDATPDITGDARETDDCRQGAFCTSTGGSTNTCRQLCDDQMDRCQQGEFCLPLAIEPSFGICDEADGCNTVTQADCDDPNGCYLVHGTNGDLLSECLEFITDQGRTGAVGEPCEFIDSCEPGAQCTDLLADGGTADESTCRKICNAASGSDAGVPDAGTSSCPGSTQCVAVTANMNGTNETPGTPGFCL